MPDSDVSDDHVISAAVATPSGTRRSSRRSARSRFEITDHMVAALQDAASSLLSTRVSFKRAEKALRENNGDQNSALCDLSG